MRAGPIYGPAGFINIPASAWVKQVRRVDACRRAAHACESGRSAFSRSDALADRVAEERQGVFVAQEACGAVGDAPVVVLLDELPAVEAHAVDVGAGAGVEVDAGVAGSDGAVGGGELDDGGTDLVGAVADHRLVPLGLHHLADGGAAGHAADVDVVDA